MQGLNCYNLKKVLAFFLKMFYTNICCGMIARKREVAAANMAGFSVERMSSYKTDDKSLYQFTSAGEAESGVGSEVEIVA